jgi:VanZ family protein
MFLIFKLSSQVAEQSNQLSSGIIEAIIKLIDKIAPNSDFELNNINHIVRKNAHFIAYFVLGLLVMNALKLKNFGYKYTMIAISICVLYAISDEVHQLVIPGRSGVAKDALIDSAGASVGIGVYLLRII